uniref:NOP2/Sun RNA methyltransferase 3 n=1 Tax=Salarias fasciatus TaxID=181472 RepID=A0A672GX85_SALFA
MESFKSCQIACLNLSVVLISRLECFKCHRSKLIQQKCQISSVCETNCSSIRFLLYLIFMKHRKERSSCPAVLDLFDQQYSEELGDLWPAARAVLLDPHSWQYGVMLNRFSAVTDITQILQSQGFSTLFLSIPSLQCYIHSCPLRFPSQAHRPGQLKQYYLLNAASLLPVLALQVKDGEKVLDLCSAPGGKALAILQSANPALLCCNEPDPHRRDWLAKTLESFLPRALHSSVIVSAQDGRTFGQSEAGLYDKVLVDAPCSNDRSWLYSRNIQQGGQRLKERAKLPSLQAQLLKSALSAVRPGGIVVYSTCTLSSFENCAVVETVLDDFPEAELEDLAGSSYRRGLGILVVPQPGKTWGPMFLCRIRRRK